MRRSGARGRPARVPIAAALLVVLLLACASDAGEPSATADTTTAATGVTGGTAGTATGATGGSGATGGPTGVSDPTSTIPDACTLISSDDASIALGVDVEVVDDPFGAGVIEGDPAEFASVCAYGPTTGEQGSIVIGIAAPGSITPEEFDELTQGGIALGGPGDEGYAIDNGVLFRSGDLIVGIVVETGEGLDTDRALALELAGIAAAGLPAPGPDPANPACALLTEELAEQILGIDLVFGSDAILDEQRSGCGYRDANGPAFVSLRITRGADAATDFAGAFGAASDTEGFRELDGVGDRAFVRTGGGAVDVVVLVGDAFLATTTFSPDDDLEGQTIELATAIVGSF